MVSQHRNQCYSRSKPHIGSSPSRGFKGINCRTFQSGAGNHPSPRYISPSEANSPCIYSEPPKRSSPIPISPKTPPAAFSDELSYTELWAGPAYSKSPPPSSLPIPKFSLRQKLPAPLPGLALYPVTNSAPPSPTRESCSSDHDFFLNTASATQNLRRILHLDVADV